MIADAVYRYQAELTVKDFPKDIFEFADKIIEEFDDTDK